jgi:carbon monoxide dehydrogenase subunit G
VKIEEQFTIAVPIERFYREINDIGEIGYCIAGVKRVDVISEVESKWTVEAKAGFMARTFNLDGRITERREPEYFAFAGTGQDVDVNGYLELEAVNGNATKCRAVIEAEVTGPFATIVDLMARGPQQQLIRQTIANLRDRLERIASGETPAPHPVPPPPPEKLGVRTLVHNWLRRLFRRS